VVAYCRSFEAHSAPSAAEGTTSCAGGQLDVQGLTAVHFRLDARSAIAIIAAIEAAGEIASVAVDADTVQTAEWRIPTAAVPAAAAPSARSGQIRVDRRRLDALMSQVGELVVANRLLGRPSWSPAGNSRHSAPGSADWCPTCRPRSSKRG
jgi:chemotaxis protein histidine kinase CheA